MKLLDIVTAPWAVMPAKLEEMKAVYETHLRGDKIKLDSDLAAAVKAASADRQSVNSQNGVAVIPMEGVLTKRASWIQALCGMTSMDLVGQDLQEALDDPTIQSIILLIDSPGGTVDGTQTLANQVLAARNQKPVVALADGCCCSAAYWIASACAQVYITGDTTAVGSIGVVATHVDVSASEAQKGRKTTEITAGKYKRIASSYAPLSDEGRATIQAEVDHVCTIFVDNVATNRGVSVDTVLAQMADGRVFLGQQAMDAGLVDGVSTLSDLISQLSQNPSALPAGAGSALGNQPPLSMENPMPITKEQMAAEAPELLQSLQSEASGIETARVKGCLEASLPGHEKLALSLALDGKTTPSEAAMAINQAERQSRAAARTEIEHAGPAPVKTAGDPGQSDAQNAVTDAKTHAAHITAHIAAEAAKGRRITAEQASQELLKGKEVAHV